MRLFLILFFFVWTTPLLALEIRERVLITGETKELGISYLRPQSGSEAVGMAFYKIAEKTPDLWDWAAKTQTVIEAPEYDKQPLTTEEFNRLQNKFVNYKPQEPLIVHAQIDLNSYSEKQEILFLPYFTQAQFFPYDIFGQPVAVIAKDMEQFDKIGIPGREAEKIFSKLDKGTSTALIEITMVPGWADHEKTIKTGKDEEFYPMIAHIAQFVIWTKSQQPQALWMWRAPWYESEDNQDLINLYKK